MNIVDLLSVLPYYLDLVFVVIGISGDASFLAAIRLVRLVRVFRVFKLGRYSEYFGVRTSSPMRSIPLSRGEPILCLPYSVYVPGSS